MNRRQFLPLAGAALLGPSLLVGPAEVSGALECIYEINNVLLHCTGDPEEMRRREDESIADGMELAILDEGCLPLHWESHKLGLVKLTDDEGKTYLAERRLVRGFYAGERKGTDHAST